MPSSFNPKLYVRTASEAIDDYEKRKQFRLDNKHLALPFFVEGLCDKIPPIYPGEMGVLGAASGEGKSLAMRQWARVSEKAVSDNKSRAMVQFLSHEETTDTNAGLMLKLHKSRATLDDDLINFLGMSWGMNEEEIADLHMTNYLAMLDYAQNKQFADIMPFAANFYDYLQTTPSDPFRRKIISEESRRLQIGDDVKRLYHTGTTFSCPVVAAAQTSLKRIISPYNPVMLIPGKRDFEEAKEIYQIPDFVFSMWKVTPTYDSGVQISYPEEIPMWTFMAEDNLFFLWVLKARGHDPETCPGLFKVFPLHIENGEFVYDKVYHKHIYRGEVP